MSHGFRILVCLAGAMAGIRFVGESPDDPLIVRLAGGGAVAAVAIAIWLWRIRSARVALDRNLAQARFVPATLPIPLGGRLAGRLVLPPALAGKEMHFWVRCLRREVSHELGEDRESVIEHEVATEVGAPVHAVLTPADWRSVGGKMEALIDVPIPGTIPADAADPSPGAPVHAWEIRVRLDGGAKPIWLPFSLPVFAVTHVPRPFSDGIFEDPVARDLPRLPTYLQPQADKILIPVPSPATVPQNLRAEFAAHRLRLSQRPGAFRKQAVSLDNEVAFELSDLGPRQVFSAAIVILLAFVLLGPVPYVGAWVPWMVAAGYAAKMLEALYEKKTSRRSGGDSVWIEGNAVRILGSDGKSGMIPRYAIARIEISVVRGTPPPAVYRLAAAGPPDSKTGVRERFPIVRGVRTPAGAEFLAHWLAAGLDDPRPEVVHADSDIEALERKFGRKG